MKKWSYLLSGVFIGAVVAIAGSAFANLIKSLVGEKIAGEYVVIVNGNSPSENTKDGLLSSWKRGTELEKVVTDTESEKGNMVKSLEISSKTTESTSNKFVEIREKS
ncbi:hypothetical protein [Paenibacillus polymyxa]|uniref:hypothetical protein n=1 Tax=Paenibacillus polymyxa TaxID=1406 RepID=UPI000472CD8B|nr:hypothetical protein [Paenibacillus polymyxa]